MITCNRCKKKVNLDEIMKDGTCIDCLVNNLNYDDSVLIEIEQEMKLNNASLVSKPSIPTNRENGKIIKWALG